MPGQWSPLGHSKPQLRGMIGGGEVYNFKNKSVGSESSAWGEAMAGGVWARLREVDRKAMWKNQQRDERGREKRGAERTGEKWTRNPNVKKTNERSESCCRGKKKKRRKHNRRFHFYGGGETDARREDMNLTSSITRSLPILNLFQLLVVVRQMVRHRHETKVRSDCGRCSM